MLFNTKLIFFLLLFCSNSWALDESLRLEDAKWEVFSNHASVYALLLSKDGKTLWVGTNTGLEKRDAKTGEVHQIFTQPKDLPSNLITSLLDDGKNGLWIGTYNGGLVHYDEQGIWRTFNTENSVLSSNRIFDIIADDNEGLWIATETDRICLNLPTINNSYLSEVDEKKCSGLVHYSSEGKWQPFNTSNSGLPNNFGVGNLYKDKQGTIWIIMGLSPQIVRYKSGSWDSTVIPDGIVSISEDSQDRLWFGTIGGYGLYSTAANDIFGISVNPNPDEWFTTKNSGLPDNAINVTLSDGEDGLWVGTRYGGLAHFDTKNNKWQVFNTTNSSLPNNWVSVLLSDGLGGLWIGTRNELVHLNAQSEWQVFETYDNSLFKETVNGFVSDGHGGSWMGTDGAGLIHYTSDGKYSTFNKENSGLPSNFITYILSDNQEGLWMITAKETDDNDIQSKFDLVHYSEQDGWTVINSSFHDNFATYNEFVDSQGGVWTKDWDGNLYHCSKQGECQQLKIPMPTDSSITTLVSDKQGNLWIGMERDGATYEEGGGLIYYKNGVLQKVFNKSNSALPGNNIVQLISNTQGGVWITVSCEGYDSMSRCIAGGLVHYSELGEWNTLFDYSTFMESFGWINQAISDDMGNIWLGSVLGGLIKYEPTGKWVTFNQENSELPDNHVTQIVSDKQGGIWVGTLEGGLAHYGRNGIWTVFNSSNSVITENWIVDLHNDNQNGLWVSTASALIHITFNSVIPQQPQVQLVLERIDYQRGEHFTAQLIEKFSENYDLYAAVVLPNGNYFTFRETNNLGSVNEANVWSAQRISQLPITLLDLTLPVDLLQGRYCIYAILSPKNQDVFESQNKGLWIMDDKCIDIR